MCTLPNSQQSEALGQEGVADQFADYLWGALVKYYQKTYPKKRIGDRWASMMCTRLVVLMHQMS